MKLEQQNYIKKETERKIEIRYIWLSNYYLCIIDQYFF